MKEVSIAKGSPPNISSPEKKQLFLFKINPEPSYCSTVSFEIKADVILHFICGTSWWSLSSGSLGSPLRFFGVSLTLL
jgi:hypothetical protein